MKNKQEFENTTEIEPIKSSEEIYEQEPIKESSENEQNDEKAEQIEKESKALNALDWIKSFALALIIALLLKNFVVEPTQVQGASMQNTLHTGDRVLVNKIGLKLSPIQRGNIVVMHYDDTDEDFVKRVVGLPGEFVQLIDGSFYINGQLLEEPYVNADFTYQSSGYEWLLGEDEYFLVGDNRQPGKSRDSREFGPVNLDHIKGVASFRFYPLGDSFGKLN